MIAVSRPEAMLCRNGIVFLCALLWFSAQPVSHALLMGVRIQVTTFVFLPTAAPADIVAAQAFLLVGRFLIIEKAFENFHLTLHPILLTSSNRTPPCSTPGAWLPGIPRDSGRIPRWNQYRRPPPPRPLLKPPPPPRPPSRRGPPPSESLLGRASLTVMVFPRSCPPLNR